MSLGSRKYPGRICDPKDETRAIAGASCNINAWSKANYSADNEKHESFESIADNEYMQAHVYRLFLRN
jgi:hypothetical protein